MQSGLSASQTRGDNNSLKQHRQAVKCLNQIDELFDAMDQANMRTGAYRRQFPEWVKHTFRYSGNWGVKDPGTPQNAKDVLENLVDALAPFVPVLEPERFEDLKTYLHTVREALNADDDAIPRGTRQGALVLIENILTMIDSYKVIGDFELERSLQSLLGSLAWAAAQSKQPDRWRNILAGFFIPYSVNQAPGLEIPPLPKLLELVQGG